MKPIKSALLTFLIVILSILLGAFSSLTLFGLAYFGELDLMKSIYIFVFPGIVLGFLVGYLLGVNWSLFAYGGLAFPMLIFSIILLGIIQDGTLESFLYLLLPLSLVLSFSFFPYLGFRLRKRNFQRRQ